MEADAYDEAEFFTALAAAGVRALVIGRRALVALGLPVLTADTDLWLRIDDIARLNDAARPFGLVPSVGPAEARARGRYVLENGERVDVLVARSRTTPDGVRLTFDEAWSRRQRIPYGGVALDLPSLDDLITTKRWGGRDKDLADIRLLEALRRSRPGGA